MSEFLLRLNSSVCIHHILLIHLSINGHLSFFYLLATVNIAAAIFGCTSISLFLLSVPVGIYAEVKLLDHMVILFLMF